MPDHLGVPVAPPDDQAELGTVPLRLTPAGSADPVLSFTPRDHVREVATGEYYEVLLEGAGHWLQQERPTEVNAVLLEFLGGLT